MKRYLLAGCAVAALAAFAAAPTVAQQKTIKIGFISTFSGPVAAIGNDMRNSFELGLDHHRPQARRPAGRGDLRGRPDQARSRRAEDPEADRVRQGRFRGRLHLVERAAGFAQAAGRFQDLHDRHQCRRLAARRRAVLALRVLDLLEQRPDAAGGRPLHEPEERQDGIPDRAELRRRQGHARRRGRDLQGPDHRPRTDRAGRTSSTSPPSCRRRARPSPTRSSRSIPAAPASSSSRNTRSRG